MIAPRLASLVALSALACGCVQRRNVGSPDVIRRPPSAAASLGEAFGRQGIITTKTERYFGELVGCDDLSVYLYLNAQPSFPSGDRRAEALVSEQRETPSAWLMISWAVVERAEALLPGSDAKAWTITLTVAGSLSTATHGWWAPLSGAVWAGVGTGSILWGISNEAIRGGCPDLRPYVRYPQGVPSSILEHYGVAAPTSPPIPLPMPRNDP
jgi:hypothetical protein